MNRQRIDSFLPKAIDAIRTADIANAKGEVNGTFRGYISRFGATVAMGSLYSAIAAFRQQNSAKDDRSKLIKAMEMVIGTEEDLFRYAQHTDNAKEIILDAALAIKLALNFYTLLDEDGKPKENAKTAQDTGGGAG